MKYIFLLICAFSIQVSAATLFTLADTVDSVFQHDTDGTNAPSPLPSSGNTPLNNGNFAWGDLETDTTTNTAIFSGGTFAASDWGGQGTFTSVILDVSNFDTVDIIAQFDGAFNVATEFSHFFYQIDGGSIEAFGIGIEDTTHTDVIATINALDVSSAATLVVGFDFGHNGSSDFFNVDTLMVTGIPVPVAAVPEPATILGSLLVLGLGAMRLRKK